MDAQATAEILRPFEQMPDPRRNNRRHQLTDILVIAFFAVICGADGWEDGVQYGRCKFDWLKTFLELAGGKLVAIDGKSLRRSCSDGWDKIGMCHMVSAFVTANRMAFAQVSTNGKGRELSAIEKLLQRPDLKGAVVSIDALGCQKEIAGKIVGAEADYVLQVKENQPALLEKIKVTMADAILDDLRGLHGDQHKEVDGDHGRIETRQTWVCWDVQLLGEDLPAQWPGLACMIVTERKREINGHASVERAYIPSVHWTAGAVPNVWRALCVGTGVWRTTCTGNWM